MGLSPYWRDRRPMSCQRTGRELPKSPMLLNWWILRHWFVLSMAAVGFSLSGWEKWFSSLANFLSRFLAVSLDFAFEKTLLRSGYHLTVSLNRGTRHPCRNSFVHLEYIKFCQLYINKARRKKIQQSHLLLRLNINNVTSILKLQSCIQLQISLLLLGHHKIPFLLRCRYGGYVRCVRYHQSLCPPWPRGPTLGICSR